MDLMRLLRSLEEFLYELVGWLVFYPRTFWRILWRPAGIPQYTSAELARDSDQSFQDAISPVLMLILSVVLAHVLELAMRIAVPGGTSPMWQLLLGSNQGLLLTRSTVFCIFALGAALGTLRQEGRQVTRATLREPFSIQAFLACPFVVLFSAGELLARVPVTRVPGLLIAGGATVWYILARTSAYRAQHQASWPKALMLVLASFVSTTILVLAALWLLLT